MRRSWRFLLRLYAEMSVMFWNMGSVVCSEVKLCLICWCRCCVLCENLVMSGMIDVTVGGLGVGLVMGTDTECGMGLGTWLG